MEDFENDYNKIFERHKEIGKAICSNIIYDTNEFPYITTIKDEGEKISILYYSSYSEVLNFMIWYNKNSFEVSNLVVTSNKSSESILLSNIYLNPYINKSDNSIMNDLKKALEETGGAEAIVFNKDSQAVYKAKKIYFDDVVNVIIDEKK